MPGVRAMASKGIDADLPYSGSDAAESCRGIRSPMNPMRRLSDLEKGRANNFDALRVALSLLVIFSHSYPLLRGSNDTEPLFRMTGGQHTFGELAVEGFFVISGYLITASWQRSRGLVDYLRRRVLRIYPGFLVAVAFSSLVAAPLIAPDRAEFWRRFDFREFWKEAFNLAGAYSPGGEINGSLWSIRYEFLCYLALAAFGLMGILRRRFLVVLFSLFCTGVYASMIYFGVQIPGSRLTWLWGFPGYWPRLAACYFAGAAFHLYADRIVHSKWLAVASLVGLLTAGLIPGSKALPLLIPYLGGYLTFYLAFVPAGGLKDIARRGDLSYGLYLYAFPIQMILVDRFRPYLSPEGLAALAMVATFFFAVFSWHFVERHFLRLKRPVSSPGVDRQAGPLHAETVSPP
jgi:peptidoglycan/LPS O-acetylase OafA/YrhL